MDPLHTLDLSEFENVEFTGDPINLFSSTIIFGRNGTGKSSITKAIEKQCSDKFLVEVFSGVESVVNSDKQLNAIALGKENTKTQRTIDKLDSEAQVLHDEIEAGECFQNFKEAQAQRDASEKTFSAALSSIAKEVKNTENLSADVRSYNKKKLEADLENGVELLEESTRQIYIQRARSEALPERESQQFPQINIAKLIQSINELLQMPVAKEISIPSLDSDSNKRAFAEMGLRVHDRHRGDHCIFCDNTISEKRWDDLEAYFSSASKELAKKIDNKIEEILTHLKKQ
ncbi:MAG: AAA family ATPase, partial [Mixta calida]|nr:AAA family ATPase [Mixta calida]